MSDENIGIKKTSKQTTEKKKPKTKRDGEFGLLVLLLSRKLHLPCP